MIPLNFETLNDFIRIVCILVKSDATQTNLDNLSHVYHIEIMWTFLTVLHC